MKKKKHPSTPTGSQKSAIFCVVPFRAKICDAKNVSHKVCLAPTDRDLQARNKQTKVCPISIIYFVWPVFKVTEVAG